MIGHNTMTGYDQLIEAIELAKEKVNTFEVSNDDEAKHATATIKGFKDSLKAGEKSRKEEKAPHDKAGKEVQAKYKPHIDELNTYVKELTSVLTVYIVAEQKKAAEIARKEREQIELEAAMLCEEPEAEKKFVKANIKTAEATSFTRTTWKWEVVNEEDVPLEYFIIDEKKLNAAVKNGERNIKGIKIYSEQTVSIR